MRRNVSLVIGIVAMSTGLKAVRSRDAYTYGEGGTNQCVWHAVLVELTFHYVFYGEAELDRRDRASSLDRQEVAYSFR